jgi:hypothetical protein
MAPLADPARCHDVLGPARTDAELRNRVMPAMASPKTTQLRPDRALFRVITSLLSRRPRAVAARRRRG